MSNEDWRDIIDRGDATARRKADDAVQDDLDRITAQADQLRGIFDELKRTDPQTYDTLVDIVEGATRRNESIASVVDRVKALGATGVRLAGSITDIAGGGTLTAIRTALNLAQRP